MTSGCIGQVYFGAFSCSLVASEACGGGCSRWECCAIIDLLVDSATTLTIMAAMYFRISSGCRAGASPARGKDGNRSGCPTNRTRLRLLTPGTAERVREDSAAKSIQRMKTRRVGRCRATAAQELVTNTQRTRPPERENSHRRMSHHCAPNLLFSQERERAGFCSTAPEMIVPFASQAWNGMGTRFPPCRFPLRPPRTRNDSRPRSMSRSQSQRQRSVWSRSHPPNSFSGASTQTFSCVGLATGAISPGAIPPGGTTSLGSTSLPLG